jgi:hypothetical protein
LSQTDFIISTAAVRLIPLRKEKTVKTQEPFDFKRFQELCVTGETLCERKAWDLDNCSLEIHERHTNSTSILKRL